MTPVELATLGTSITFAGTTLGAAMVFLFRHEIKPGLQRVFLGFAAGIMIAASVWSLLIPAMEMAVDASSGPVWFPAAGGFILGAAFLLLLDRLLPHMHANTGEVEGLHSSFRKTTMLILAVTLHNIPEGLAVGLTFGFVGISGSGVTFSAAMALAIGMALQNFPEGAAISLPLKNTGMGNTRAFIWGTLSGIVEPIFGILGVLIAGSLTAVMPWMLGFAAGAMIYVVVEELIPEANLGQHSHYGTLSVLFGFLLMMVLDVALG